MRISEKTIDSKLLDRINEISELKSNFKKSDIDQFVSYDGESLYFRELDVNPLDELIRFSNISKIKNNNKSNEFIFNSEEDILYLPNKKIATSSKFPKLLTELELKDIIDLDGCIEKYKFIGDKLILLLSNGMLKVFNLKDFEEVFECNPINEIKVNFSVEFLNTFDILDFDFYGDNILISTKREGLFLINSKGEVKDLLISEKGINNFKYMGDNKVLVTIERISNSNVKLYDIDTGMLVESYNHMRYDAEQRPFDLKVSKDSFFILGVPLENGLSQRNIHIWMKENDFWVNKDYSIYPHNPSIDYVTKFLVKSDENIHVVGGYKEDLFIWTWNLNNISTMSEKIIPEIDIELVDNVYIKDDIITLDIDNRIVKLDSNGNILRNLIALDMELDNREIKGFKELDNTLYILDVDSIKKYSIPKHSDNNTFNIQLSRGNMNEIHVYVKGNDEMGLRVVDKNKLISTENVKMIKVDKGEVYMKIYDDSSKDLVLIISNPSDEIIKDVILMYDRVIYKGDV
jgi:hypothetical protein